MKNKKCMVLLLAAMLVGCSDSHHQEADDGTTPPPQGETHAAIAALEESGAIPRLERSNSLAGTDADGNGIRDDVDAYIVQNYSGEEQLAAVNQYARTMQASLLLPENDREAARVVALRSARAIYCIHSKFGNGKGYRVTSEIRGVTTNTKPRLLAYLSYNRSLNGMVFSNPQGEVCE